MGVAAAKLPEGAKKSIKVVCYSSALLLPSSTKPFLPAEERKTLLRMIEAINI